MKKTIVSIVVLLCFSMSVFAQSIEALASPGVDSFADVSGSAMSSVEMEKTDGEFLQLLVGIAAGLIGYVVEHAITGQPMTLGGAAIAAVAGAVTGGIGGPVTSRVSSEIIKSVWGPVAKSIKVDTGSVIRNLVIGVISGAAAGAGSGR